MRYYKIVLTQYGSDKELQTFTSFGNGATDIGALDIEMDIPIVGYGAVGGTEMGAAYVRIWGIGLKQISQATDYNPKLTGIDPQTGASVLQPTTTISIYGGMQAGLPLANPKQSGLLARGVVRQCFGNWVGTDQTMDIYFGTELASLAPVNFSLNWPKGTPLKLILDRTVKIAFPGYTSVINISDSLVLPNDEAGFYGSLTEFASYLRAISKHINPDPSYSGVRMTLQDKQFTFDDGTVLTAPINISFFDLIGQPTWLGVATISFMTTMRADITPANWIQLPPAQYTTSVASNEYSRANVQFQGRYQITQARHVGRFRNPSGMQWCSVFQANFGANTVAPVVVPANYITNPRQAF